MHPHKPGMAGSPSTDDERVASLSAHGTATSLARPVALAGPVLLLLLGLLSACSDDKPSTSPPASLNTLEFTREDGSRIDFTAQARTWAWCGPWEDGVVETPALHVWVGDPADRNAPGFWLQAVYGDFVVGDTLRFPNRFVWDQPDSARVFVWDPPNELGTDGEDASGWIVFRQLPCPSEGAVEFAIDAVLASEHGDGPSVVLKGEWRQATTGAPPWVGERAVCLTPAR